MFFSMKILFFHFVRVFWSLIICYKFSIEYTGFFSRCVLILDYLKESLAFKHIN